MGIHSIRSLMRPSLRVAQGLSVLALIFFCCAVGLLAMGCVASLATPIKLSILCAVAAAWAQGLAALTHTWCLLISMIARTDDSRASTSFDNRVFLLATMGWVAWGLVQAAARLIPYVILKPWLLGFFIGVACGQVMAIHLLRRVIRSINSPPPTTDSGNTLSA